MALTPDEEKRLIGAINGLTRSKQETILENENSFLKWIKKAASWLWDRIAESAISTLLSSIWKAIFG